MIPCLCQKQHMKNNRKSYEELAVRVARLLAAIADVLQKAKLEKLNGMEGNVSHLLQFGTVLDRPPVTP
jgi:hypothetical protein